MAASSFAVITCSTPFLRPKNSTAIIKNGVFTSIKELPTCNCSAQQISLRSLCNWKFYWNYSESFNLSACSSTNDNWIEVEAGAPREYRDDEFMVVNFYRFVSIQNPEEEVSKHLSFMQVICSSFIFGSKFFYCFILCQCHF